MISVSYSDFISVVFMAELSNWLSNCTNMACSVIPESSAFHKLSPAAWQCYTAWPRRLVEWPALHENVDYICPWPATSPAHISNNGLRVSWYQKDKTILDFNEARDDEVAVASAGPYANHLQFDPDRQPHQYLITQCSPLLLLRDFHSNQISKWKNHKIISYIFHQLVNWFLLQ